MHCFCWYFCRRHANCRWREAPTRWLQRAHLTGILTQEWIIDQPGSLYLSRFWCQTLLGRLLTWFLSPLWCPQVLSLASHLKPHRYLQVPMPLNSLSSWVQLILILFCLGRMLGSLSSLFESVFMASALWSSSPSCLIPESFLPSISLVLTNHKHWWLCFYFGYGFRVYFKLNNENKNWTLAFTFNIYINI